MERVRERLITAHIALTTLQELVGKESVSEVERDAAIQRFEYTFEAAWKSAQRFLIEVEGIDLGSPKGVIRSAQQVGLLNENQARQALVMADDRNLTAHTYNEKLAQAIYQRLAGHASILDAWLEAMLNRLAGLD